MNPVSRITGEARAEFEGRGGLILIKRGAGGEEGWEGTSEAAQFVCGNFKSFLCGERLGMWRGGRRAGGGGGLVRTDVGVCYTRGARSPRWGGWWGRRGRWGRGRVGIAATARTALKRY